jgi:hypothetical protein
MHTAAHLQDIYNYSKVKKSRAIPANMPTGHGDL